MESSFIHCQEQSEMIGHCKQSSLFFFAKINLHFHHKNYSKKKLEFHEYTESQNTFQVILLSTDSHIV